MVYLAPVCAGLTLTSTSKWVVMVLSYINVCSCAHDSVLLCSVDGEVIQPVLVTRCWSVCHFLRVPGSLHWREARQIAEIRVFTVGVTGSLTQHSLFFCTALCVCVSVCAYVCAYVLYDLDLQDGQCADKSLLSGTRLGTLLEQRAPEMYLWRWKHEKYLK